jgi:hypothetical protein
MALFLIEQRRLAWLQRQAEQRKARREKRKADEPGLFPEPAEGAP